MKLVYLIHSYDIFRCIASITLDKSKIISYLVQILIKNLTAIDILSALWGSSINCVTLQERIRGPQSVRQCDRGRGWIDSEVNEKDRLLHGVTLSSVFGQLESLDAIFVRQM